MAEKVRILAPKHLKPATRRWFESVLRNYVLEEHHVRILTMAAESWDECQAARKVIEKHGMTFVDRFGQPKARPEVAIESECRIAFARLIRELCLDVELPKDTGRPPSLY